MTDQLLDRPLRTSGDRCSQITCSRGAKLGDFGVKAVQQPGSIHTGSKPDTNAARGPPPSRSYRPKIAHTSRGAAHAFDYGVARGRDTDGGALVERRLAAARPARHLAATRMGSGGTSGFGRVVSTLTRTPRGVRRRDVAAPRPTIQVAAHGPQRRQVSRAGSLDAGACRPWDAPRWTPGRFWADAAAWRRLQNRGLPAPARARPQRHQHRALRPVRSHHRPAGRSHVGACIRHSPPWWGASAKAANSRMWSMHSETPAGRHHGRAQRAVAFP